MIWHSISKDKALQNLNTSADTGLSSKEAQKRLKSYGYNILSSKKKKGILSRFFEQFKDFMIITLIVAAIIQLLVSYLHNELDFVEPSIIILIVVLNAI